MARWRRRVSDLSDRDGHHEDKLYVAFFPAKFAQRREEAVGAVFGCVKVERDVFDAMPISVQRAGCLRHPHPRGQYDKRTGGH